MSRFREIEEECCTANRALGSSGLVDLTLGNKSVLEPGAGVFALKPSGVDYADLMPEDMVSVDLQGQVVEGRWRPSSDTPTHAAVLRSFAGIRSVAHAHSR